MSSIAHTPPVSPDDAAGAFAGQTIDACTATMELAALYVGDRLGLYAALRDRPATAGELAGRTGLDTRYVREWLEQQASAGVLACADPDQTPDEREFSLPAGHDEALLDRESLVAVAGFVRATIASLSTLPQLLDAFRTGAGIPYADYGEDMRQGIADGNRPMFHHQLGQEWLPAMPDVHARLRRSDGARVADVACGSGWSSIAIARTYPSARVDGLDEDAASIDEARAHAAEAGVADRVRFFRQDAADAGLDGSYDLVTIFEALHDMAQPVEALQTARRLLAPGGCVLVGDERAAERFTAPAEDPLERFFYGYSVLHCLPVGRVGQPSAATGTVLRPDTLRAYAAEAGFRQVTVLPVEHDFWRFYRLDV